MKIAKGDTVYNKKYGIGRVVREWNSFLACPECYHEVHTKIAPCHEVRAIEVTGLGVWDVAFADKVHSINQTNLHEAPKKT